MPRAKASRHYDGLQGIYSLSLLLRTPGQPPRVRCQSPLTFLRDFQMADQPKTGPTPIAPDAVKQPEKTTTDGKPIAAATAPPVAEPKKN